MTQIPSTKRKEPGRGWWYWWRRRLRWFYDGLFGYRILFFLGMVAFLTCVWGGVLLVFWIFRDEALLVVAWIAATVKWLIGS